MSDQKKEGGSSSKEKWKKDIEKNLESADNAFSELLRAYPKEENKDSLKRVFERKSKQSKKKINKALERMNALGKRGKISQEEANRFIRKMEKKKQEVYKKQKLLIRKFEGQKQE